MERTACTFIMKATSSDPAEGRPGKLYLALMWPQAPVHYKGAGDQQLAGAAGQTTVTEEGLLNSWGFQIKKEKGYKARWKQQLKGIFHLNWNPAPSKVSFGDPFRGTAISWPHFSHVCMRPISGYSVSQHRLFLVTHSTELQKEPKSTMRPWPIRARWWLLPQVNGQGLEERNGLLAVAASILQCHSLSASNSFYLQYELQNLRIKGTSLHESIKAAVLWDASFSPFKDLREIKLALEESVSVVSGEQKSKWGSAQRL